MTMMSTSYPSASIVIPELRDFLRLAGEGLDAGTAEARSHYEHRTIGIEGELAAMLTRSYAKQYLSERGLVTESFELVDVANIGLRVVVPAAERRYRVVIWKSPDETIPVPGHSRLRRLFLTRNQLAFELDIDWAQQEINLVLTWNASPEYYLTDLYLHMPKRTAEKFFKTPESYWSERIKLPAELERPTVHTNVAEEKELPYVKAEDGKDKAKEQQ